MRWIDDLEEALCDGFVWCMDHAHVIAFALIIGIVVVGALAAWTN